jgi:predicted nucleic acid-binding protein
MRFWDTSAAVAMPAGQHKGSGLDSLTEDDPAMAIWWGTKVEMLSAFCRLRREGRADEAAFEELLRGIDVLCRQADEIQPSEDLRQVAVRLVKSHCLTAADSLQLAAAVVWADRDPSNAEFVCLDKRLRTAAGVEGFRVLPA